MADWAYSDDPHVQEQLDRLNRMTPGRDILGRDRLRQLLVKLGNPEENLPPTFHVAGTNGKGSTCTYLRGAIAAVGLSAHVYTSPHLVRLNERIRLANRLIGDDMLANILADTIDAAEGQEITFFEATTAAAFLAFARVPADACIVEVGIGGRLDATNVLPRSIVCGIAQLGIDHQAYLGDTIESIAAEKAGIAKPGVPLVTQSYTAASADRIAAIASAVGAPLIVEGRDWQVESFGDGIRYLDSSGTLLLPHPALPGEHQTNNAGLAIAMLRNQQTLNIDSKAIAVSLETARWPARLSRLSPGPVTDLLPSRSQVWLDGAHNVAAMTAVARFLDGKLDARGTLHVVIALLNDKDLPGVLSCFNGMRVRFYAVPIIGYDCRSPGEILAEAERQGFVAETASDFSTALRAVAANAKLDDTPTVLITGSLYLSGQVLRENDELPD